MNVWCIRGSYFFPSAEKKRRCGDDDNASDRANRRYGDDGGNSSRNGKATTAKNDGREARRRLVTAVRLTGKNKRHVYTRDAFAAPISFTGRKETKTQVMIIRERAGLLPKTR